MALPKTKASALLIKAMTSTSIAVLSTSAVASDYSFPYSYGSNNDRSLVSAHSIGEGWYLRGEIGPNLTYNNTERYDQIGSVATDDSLFESVSFNVGVGKRINDYFRADVTAGQADLSAYERTIRLTAVPAGHPCDGTAQVGDPAVTTPVFIDNCDQIDVFELGAISAMANAYVDLPGAWGLRPFIGAGIGISQVTWREDYGQIRCVPDPVPEEACNGRAIGETVVTETSEFEEVQYNLTWSVAAGAGYDLGEGVTLEGLYRYTNYGGLDGVVSPAFGTFDIGDLETHTLNIGLRVELPSHY